MNKAHHRTLHVVGSRRPGKWEFVILLVIALVSSARLLAQQPLLASAATEANLPDAPNMRGAQQMPNPQISQLPGIVTGIVSDIRGGLVPRATVVLSAKGASEQQTITTDGEGNFSFKAVPPGSYTVTISSPGLETFLSPVFLVRPGQFYELPAIALPIAPESTTVNVVVTQSEVADDQIKAEVQQRILGVVPNFYTSFIWNAAPLNTRQKFKISFRSIIDPTVFLGTGIVAAIEQHQNTFPEYGCCLGGYGKRYGAAFADATIGRIIGSAVFPSILRQDPRYFYLGPASSTGKRLKHALLAGVVARGDNGRWQPNYSHILGNASAGAISTLYHPASNSAASLALDNAIIGVAGGAFQGIFREFVWPRFTTKVPAYATGKPVHDSAAKASKP